MPKVIHALEEDKEVFAHARQEQQKKDAEAVLLDLKELERLLLVVADETLLDDARKLEAAELKIEGDLDDPFQLLLKLEEHAKRMNVQTQEQLIKKIHATREKLMAMYENMIRDIKVQYTAAFAMARSKAGGDEHKWLAEKRGITKIMLADAMRDVYKIRTDKSDIKKDLSAFADLDKAMERDIVMMQDAHANLSKLVIDVNQKEEKLDKVIEAMVKHVNTVFDRFANIFRVFATYFFMILEDENHVKSFREELRSTGYPEKYLAEVQHVEAVEEHTIEAHIQNLVNVLANMRHIPQQALSTR